MSTSTFITYIFSNPNHHEMNIKTAFVTVSLLGSLSFVLRLTQSGLTAWMEVVEIFNFLSVGLTFHCLTTH